MLEALKLIENSTKEYIEIVASPNNELAPWNSKFGGAPFLPENIIYPTANDGSPLHLLAQINFAEIPHLPPYPKHGLLQFYIADDDIYGMSFEDQTRQDGFRIIFIPQVNADALQQEIRHFSNSSYMPMSKAHGLKFTKKRMPILPCNYKFYDQYQEILQNGSVSEEFEDLYYKLFGSYFAGHRLGGFPSFCQGDPREESDNKDFLLLQLDSDKEIGWGDSGVANFFINEQALARLDFTEVYYTWDCY